MARAERADNPGSRPVKQGANGAQQVFKRGQIRQKCAAHDSSPQKACGMDMLGLHHVETKIIPNTPAYLKGDQYQTGMKVESRERQSLALCFNW